MHFQVIIVGAGPGGLTCAKILAQNGVKCLVVEQKASIGQKVCAGGITWSGLIQNVPEDLIEKAFSNQTIKTRFQNFSIQARNPIIATIDRKILGQFMVENAIDAGAKVLTSNRVAAIENHHLYIKNRKTGEVSKFTFDYLVGADGSSSIVRRYLGLKTVNAGIGIHYQVAADVEKMEWHLDSRYFGNGYGWIFPHKNTVSIGAYADKNVMKSSALKNNLLKWSNVNGYDLSASQTRAGVINFDYQGHQFGNIFLIGDAAGLASPLTGEGIYPAIISAETIAGIILNRNCDQTSFVSMVNKHRFFLKMIKRTGRSSFFNKVIIELAAFGLRSGLIGFQNVEMAG